LLNKSREKTTFSQELGKLFTMNESSPTKRLKGEEIPLPTEQSFNAKWLLLDLFGKRIRPLCEEIMNGSRKSVGILYDFLAYYSDHCISERHKLLFFMEDLHCKTLNDECPCFIPKLIAFVIFRKRSIRDLVNHHMPQLIVDEILKLSDTGSLLLYLIRFLPHPSITNPIPTPDNVILYAKVYGTTFGFYCPQSDSRWERELANVFMESPFKISIIVSIRDTFAFSDNIASRNHGDDKLIWNYQPDFKQLTCKAKSSYIVYEDLKKILDTNPIHLENVIADHKRRISVLFLLFLARKDQNSFFYDKGLPKDMFRLIIGLIPK
jgi:hypothetical protein